MMSVEGQLDEVYERLAKTGPEFEGWLSNHGPMAADALMRIGRAELVDGWLAGYTSRLEPPPQGRWRIREDDWREALGDPSRLGDWTAFFLWQVEERPWQELLADWWQRLLPGGDRRRNPCTGPDRPRRTCPRGSRDGRPTERAGPSPRVLGSALAGRPAPGKPCRHCSGRPGAPPVAVRPGRRRHTGTARRAGPGTGLAGRAGPPGACGRG